MKIPHNLVFLLQFLPNDFEPHHGDHYFPEPEVKIEEQNRGAVLLTFESVINDKTMSEDVKLKVENIGTEPEEPSHFCKVCHLVFKSPKTLLMHQRRKHKKFRRFFQHVCDHCGMSYDAKNSLIAHIRRKHGPDANVDDMKERVCDICALVFKGLSRLRMHMRRKHGSYAESFKHKCEDCGLTYEKYASLIVHRRRKHVDAPKPKAQWYSCPFCSKLFTRRETYSRHIQRKHKVEEDDKPKNSETDLVLKNAIKNEKSGEVTCSYCPLMFSSIMYLKLHMRRKHNVMTDEFRLKCKLCNLSYDKVESLKRHVRRKHEPGKYCEVCCKNFPSMDSYLNHSHAKVVKECNMCGLIFATQGGLSKHLRCTHKIPTDKTVFCHICNAGFYDKRQLKPHFMRVHLQVSYTCQFCSKLFKAKESYRRHLMFKHPDKYVEETKTHKCEKCPEVYVNEFELCRHINMAHNETTEVVIKKEEQEFNRNLFKCTKCVNEYSTWEELRVHFEQTHHANEETQCQACGELMPRSELPKHMKMHDNIEMTCKYCEFKTMSRFSMTQHTLRHKNAATITCDFNGCRYKTFYEDAMAKHKRRHNDLGVKLQCASCPFQTMNKYILKYHEEAHSTGKKRYTCDQCDYATILPANLVQHKYKHSTEKRFKCEVCPFATKYNTSLRFHIRKKHCDLPTLR